MVDNIIRCFENRVSNKANLWKWEKFTHVSNGVHRYYYRTDKKAFLSQRDIRVLKSIWRCDDFFDPFSSDKKKLEGLGYSDQNKLYSGLMNQLYMNGFLVFSDKKFTLTRLAREWMVFQGFVPRLYCKDGCIFELLDVNPLLMRKAKPKSIETDAKLMIQLQSGIIENEKMTTEEKLARLGFNNGKKK